MVLSKHDDDVVLLHTCTRYYTNKSSGLRIQGQWAALDKKKEFHACSLSTQESTCKPWRLYYYYHLPPGQQTKWHVTAWLNLHHSIYTSVGNTRIKNWNSKARLHSIAEQEIFADVKFHRVTIQVFRRNFCGSKFCASAWARSHPPSMTNTHKAICWNYRGSYFHSSRTINKNHGILHHVKISCYIILYGMSCIIVGLTSLMTVALFWEVVSLPPPLRDLTCSSHLAARAERALGVASSSSLCFMSSIIFLALSFLSSLNAASFFACSSWILLSSSSVRRCDLTSLSRSLYALNIYWEMINIMIVWKNRYLRGMYYNPKMQILFYNAKLKVPLKI